MQRTCNSRRECSSSSYLRFSETRTLLNRASFSAVVKLIPTRSDAPRGQTVFRSRTVSLIKSEFTILHITRYLVFRTTTAQNDVSQYCAVALSATGKRDNCFQMTTVAVRK